MKAWKRFLADIEGQSQVYVVGPMLPHGYRAKAPTIFVDGGMDALANDDSGEFPWISVGDSDSTIRKLDIVLPKEKNHSDLAYVLHSLPAEISHVELLGFLGGRRDHEVINYGEVHEFLHRRSDSFTTVRFDQSVIAFSAGSLTLPIEGQFSVVVFEDSMVSITGACRYTLPEPKFMRTVSSFGLSNLGHGQVVVTSNLPCFIFLS